MKDPVEEQIEEAISRGDFDHLPGKGKPLPRGDDGPGWWARRKVAELRREERIEAFAGEIEERVGQLWTLPRESEVRAAVEHLNDEINAFNSPLADAEKLELIDPEATVGVWRRMWRMRGETEDGRRKTEDGRREW